MLTTDGRRRVQLYIAAGFALLMLGATASALWAPAPAPYAWAVQFVGAVALLVGFARARDRGVLTRHPILSRSGIALGAIAVTAYGLSLIYAIVRGSGRF